MNAALAVLARRIRVTGIVQGVGFRPFVWRLALLNAQGKAIEGDPLAHIGELDNAATCAFQDETVLRMACLLEIRPEVVAHDLHPDDHSTRAALAAF